MQRRHRMFAFAASAAAAALLAAALPGPAAAQRPPDSLRSRVAPPDDAVVKAYIDSGVASAAPHQVTEQEWAQVDAALRALPALHRRVLDHHLRRLSFIDVAPGGGNALTRTVDPTAATKQFDITLRAGILHETLAEFLTGKERGVFEADGSGQTVTIEAGSASALPYVLLHEATHAVDATLGLTANPGHPLQAGIWLDNRRLAPPYDRSPIRSTAFRGGAKLPAARAQALYQALGRTPFVSLYATAAAGEDLAELVAWHQLATQHHQALAIVVQDARGRVLYRHEPLRSPLVRSRFAAVQDVLARQDG